jgi:hypothetical protein
LTGGSVNGVINVSQNKAIYRRCTERRVYSDSGSTLELKETYSRPEDATAPSQAYVEVVHKDKSDNILARDRHFYFGSPRDSYSIQPYGYAKWKDGKEYQTKFYDKGPGGALLRTVDNTFEQGPLGGTGDSAPPADTRLTKVETTLDDGQMSKQEFAYDAFNNKTEVREYNFGSPSLARKTTTSYLTSNGINYATVNPDIVNPDAHATVHLRSLPLQESVYDSSLTEKARTTYEYDNYTAT